MFLHHNYNPGSVWSFSKAFKPVTARDDRKYNWLVKGIREQGCSAGIKTNDLSIPKKFVPGSGEVVFPYFTLISR